MAPSDLFCQFSDHKSFTNKDSHGQVSGIQEWIPYERQVLEYDTNGNHIETIAYNWDADHEIWNAFWRLVRHYDGNNIENESFTYNWDTIGNDWVSEVHSIYSYDTSGHMIERLYWRRDHILGELVKYGRSVYSYDGHGNKTEEIRYEWTGNPPDWAAMLRYLYTYDTSTTQMEIHVWDSDSNRWQASWRYVYAYDSAGNVMEDVSYRWNSGEVWMENQKIIRTYDANGYLTNISAYDWDTADSSWDASYLMYRILDLNGNTLEEYAYSLDTATGDTINQRYNTFLYNEAGQKTEEIEYKWIETFTSADPYAISDGEIFVYPNPATDRFTISLPETGMVRRIEILDFRGRMVRLIDHHLDRSITVSREELPSGLYFIRIITDKIQVRKIILR
jgi:hypothetical protein